MSQIDRNNKTQYNWISSFPHPSHLNNRDVLLFCLKKWTSFFKAKKKKNRVSMLSTRNSPIAGGRCLFVHRWQHLLACHSLSHSLSIEGGSVRSASQKKSHDFYQQLDALYTALKCPLGNESYEKCLFTWAKPSVPHGMHTHWLLGDEINSGDHLIFKTIIPAKEEVYMNWF